MRNLISFEEVELASLEIRKAKNGNPYATGIIILRDEQGKYEASLPLRSFNAADSFAALVRTESNPETSGGDLHYEDDSDAETRERVPSKATRPKATVSGWLRSTKDKSGKWSTCLMVESLSI